jgi:tRNA(His) guanylyltransferase
MAKSQYEYVKYFEQDDSLLKHCWIVVRLDGKGFTKYVDSGWYDVDVSDSHTNQL